MTDPQQLSDAELFAIAGIQPQAVRPASGQRPAQTQSQSQPRGIRNNNPGNIEDGAFARSLPGYAGSDGRFAIFNDPQAGTQAKTRLLGSYLQRGFDTPGEIINRWAPPSDNNPTERYAQYVASRVGVGVNDPIRPEQIPILAQAIAEFENGQQQASATGQEAPADLSSMSDDALLAIVGQGATQAIGSRANPIDLTNIRYEDEYAALKKGAFVRDRDGRVYALPSDAWTGNPDASSVQQSGNVYQDYQTAGDTAMAGMTAFAEQIPFADEAIAGAAGAISGRGYDQVRDQMMQDRQYFNDTQGLARDVGGLAGFGATLAVAPGASWVAQGPNTFYRANRASAVAAPIAALMGLGNTDGNLQQRLTQGGIAGLTGIAGGQVGQRAVEAVPAITRRLGSGFAEAGARLQRGVGIQPQDAVITPRTTQAAESYVQRLIDGSGRDLAALPPISAAKPLTAAEAIGPSGVSQVTALSRRSGRTGQLAQDALSARAEEQSSRLIADIADAAGVNPAVARENIAALVDQGRARAAPLYEAAYARPGAPRSPLLDELMQRPSVREATRRAYRIAAEEGRDPTTLGFDFDAAGDVVHVRDPSMQTMDYIKRGLDDVLEGYRDPTSGRMSLDTAGRAAQATRTAFRAELGRINPAYEAALAAGGDAPRLEEAFRVGPRLMSSATPERVFRDRLQRMGDEERQALVAGVVDDLFTRARSGRLNLRQLRVPAMQAKFSALLGPQKADDLMQKVALEMEMARTGARMAPGTNSTTGEVMAAMKEQDQGVGLFADFARNLETSPGPVSAVMRTGAQTAMAPLAGFVRGLQSPAPQGVRDEIGRLLLSSPSELQALLQARPVPAPPRAGLFGSRYGQLSENLRQQVSR